MSSKHTLFFKSLVEKRTTGISLGTMQNHLHWAEVRYTIRAVTFWRISPLCWPYLVAHQLSLPGTAVSLKGQSDSCCLITNGHHQLCKDICAGKVDTMGYSVALWQTKHLLNSHQQKALISKPNIFTMGRLFKDLSATD